MLREAAEIIDIALLDHVIVGDPKADPLGVGHYSFRERASCEALLTTEINVTLFTIYAVFTFL